MGRGAGKEIPDARGNLGSEDKRNVSGMAISHVGDLLISGHGVFIASLQGGGNWERVRIACFLGVRINLFKY